MRPFILTTSFCVAVCLALSRGAAAKVPESTISVRGSADVSVVPDRAVLTISIESREVELDRAVADNDKKVQLVREFLKSTRVDPRHIRTELMNIRPLYRPPVKDEPVNRIITPIGYTVHRGLVVKIMDLESFEAILSGLTKQGVNHIDGVRFETSDLKKYRDLARLQAVRHAKGKALAMAGELGTSLASVCSITENPEACFGRSYYGRPQGMSQMSSSVEDSGSAAQAGAIDVKASVDVVFRLNQEKAPAE